MKETSLQAGWGIDFPDSCTASDVCGILNSKRLYEWDWDLFIWDLPYLYKLLTTCPAAFDYLFATRFLVARASHLMMTGPFNSSLPEIWEGVRHHKLDTCSRSTCSHSWHKRLVFVNNT